jgi:hypothetical protein
MGSSGDVTALPTPASSAGAAPPPRSKPTAQSAPLSELESQEADGRGPRFFFARRLGRTLAPVTRAVRAMGRSIGAERSMAFWTSCIVHLGLMLLLLLIPLVSQLQQGNPLIATLGPSSTPSELIAPIASSVSSGQPSDAAVGDLQVASPTATLSNVLPVATTLQSIRGNLPSATEASEGPEGLQVLRSTIGGLEGRSESQRAELLERYGGSAAGEAAKNLALQWIVDHQCNDGGWSLKLEKCDCDGACQHAAEVEGRAAATGLALLTLLGSGHTHQSGPYAKNIHRGLYFLRSRLDRDEHGGRFAMNVENEMYAHPIATLAMTEAMAMTGDKSFEEEAFAALDFICYAQHAKGGWRYKVREPGDLTISTWMLMALKSGRRIGYTIPTPVTLGLKEFLLSTSSDRESRYGYLPGEKRPEATTTAVGLAARMFLDWNYASEPLARGCAVLVKEGPSTNDVYYNYYATLTLHLARDPGWDRWNRELSAWLLKTQSQDGHERGSWYFPGEFHNEVGGRLYTTCMAALILEVYYRYLPMFEDQAFPL